MKKNTLLYCFALVAMPLLSIAVPDRTFAQSNVNQLSEAEKRGGWKLLFDGKSTDQWRNFKKDTLSDGWRIFNGALTRTSDGAGDIVTKEKYDAFELVLDYKIIDGGNSGLMFHVSEKYAQPWHSGPEVQIQDNVNGKDPEKAGWMYQLYQPVIEPWFKQRGETDASRPAGEWNQLYLRVSDNDGEVCLNGFRYYQFKKGSKDWNQRVAKSKFAKFPRFGKAQTGHICLQDHGDAVAFRNIKIRRIGQDGSVPQPIDGKLGMKGKLAFPNLEWDQWEPVDEDGRLRPLRILELTHANDGTNRLFAMSQYGGIWTFDNDPNVKKSHLFLDLRGNVFDWKGRGGNEQGLLGLAMHPNYKSNGKFYVYYSHPKETKSVISEFSVSSSDPNRADPNSEVVLMEIDQPYQNHNGGSIEFGPDGYLYVGLGDGGDRCDPTAAGQDLSSLLGSILRIDVDNPSGGNRYGIPSDNPFVNRSGVRPEIFALGVRNPWRLAFDSELGDLWIGDVGQELWEEVNVIKSGGNYGWSNREGMSTFGNRPEVEGVGAPIDPVWQYDHRVGRSITGGRVYRSSRLPQLNGKYLYADYVTGTVWALSFDPETKRATRNEEVTPDTIPVLAFGEDQNGEVYYMTNNARGECIYRFED